MKNYNIVLIIFLFTNIYYSQERKSPKKIPQKGEYIHVATKTIFPINIEDLVIKDIHSFNKEDTNIGVSYESENNKTIITTYIYPAFEGTEGRLRNEYLNSLQAISNDLKSEIVINQEATKYLGAKYICNGYKAIIKSKMNSEINHLSLFECGTWFLKIRITSNELDSLQIQKIEKEILNRISPSKLTENNPLDKESKILIAPALKAYKAMIVPVIKSCAKKLEWINENISENERASGFPDLYLNLHIESYKEFAKYGIQLKDSLNEKSTPYVNEIVSIVNSGFLAEYIMKKNNMIMIVPENTKFNFQGYDEWEKKHKLEIDYNQLMSLIIYRKK